MDHFLVALPNFVAQLGLLGLLVIPSGQLTDRHENLTYQLTDRHENLTYQLTDRHKNLTYQLTDRHGKVEMTGIVHQTFFVFLELSHIGGYEVCGVLYSKSVKYICLLPGQRFEGRRPENR